MEKKSYTDVLIEINSRLSSIETTTQYQETHLRNINGQLEKQNARIHKNARAISKIYGVGAGIILLGGGISGILKLCGIY